MINETADISGDVGVYMHRALILATSAIYRTSPNPRVGCVLVDQAGKIIGEGSTQRAGEAHAEVMALRDAQARGFSTSGCTAYVTLEPCSHQGRTGPCCEALSAAGVSRVVVSLLDPNPLVAGQGLAKLRAAGVAVEMAADGGTSRELNLGFFSRMLRKVPWVRMKAASSLDGVAALENGVSQWITSQEARDDGHAWRARSCAVLTGIGTVLADDPRLDVRQVYTSRQPNLVVLDSNLRTPLDAQLFLPTRSVLIYCSQWDKDRAVALQGRGATVICLPAPNGQVDVAAVLRDLAQREVNELHVEAGPRLSGSLIAAGLVDEVLIYIAPKLLGRGAPIALWGPLTDFRQAMELGFHSVECVGSDLRIIARGHGRDQF